MLTPRPETPTPALDLAFRRQKPTRAQLDDFQQAQALLLESINPRESEEHLKKLLADFLAHSGVLGSDYYLNVSKRRDLVIRTGPKETAPVGTIIEVKRAANAAEMVTPNDLNRKAFHELLLYYLEDRRDGLADNLRRLVITNGYEWFVFDAGHRYPGSRPLRPHPRRGGPARRVRYGAGARLALFRALPIQAH